MRRNDRLAGPSTGNPIRVDPLDDSGGPILKAAVFLGDEGRIREDFANYFRLWHPLFPFLDGRSLSLKLEDAFILARELSNDRGSNNTATSDFPAFPYLSMDEALVQSTIFRAVITLGSLRGDTPEDAVPTITHDRLRDLRSPQQAMHLAQLLVSACQAATISEILALQGLLSIQICLFGLRETRPAMHIGGLLTSECA